MNRLRLLAAAALLTMLVGATATPLMAAPGGASEAAAGTIPTKNLLEALKEAGC